MPEDTHSEVITGDQPFKQPPAALGGAPEPTEPTPEDQAAAAFAAEHQTDSEQEQDLKLKAKDATTEATAAPDAPKPNTPVQTHDGPRYVGKLTGHSTSIETGEAISMPMELPTPQTLEGAFRVFKTYQPSASREAFQIDAENATDNTLRQKLDNGWGG